MKVMSAPEVSQLNGDSVTNKLYPVLSMDGQISPSQRASCISPSPRPMLLAALHFPGANYKNILYLQNAGNNRKKYRSVRFNSVVVGTVVRTL